MNLESTILDKAEFKTRQNLTTYNCKILSYGKARILDKKQSTKSQMEKSKSKTCQIEKATKTVKQPSNIL